MKILRDKKPDVRKRFFSGENLLNLMKHMNAISIQCNFYQFFILIRASSMRGNL